MNESAQKLVDEAISEWTEQGRAKEQVYAVVNFFTGRGIQLVADLLSMAGSETPDRPNSPTKSEHQMSVRCVLVNYVPAKKYYTFWCTHHATNVFLLSESTVQSNNPTKLRPIANDWWKSSTDKERLDSLRYRINKVISHLNERNE